ncbi:MAG: hypothetical protein ACI8XO_004361 [Verrucomicrobiales bacterium]|jgi:hypothetical protein
MISEQIYLRPLYRPMRFSKPCLILCLVLGALLYPSRAEKFNFGAFKQRLPWIWEKPARIEPPEGPARLDPVDRFVQAKLKEENLAPAPAAGDRIWLRRAHFAITGLPPTVDDLKAFDADTSPDQKQNAVRRLLASPHYGERWARHWMDLVRYAESRGHESDYSIANAHHYRDYLIRAFNADVPYDQFVTEHIAGDQLEKPRLHPETGGNESLLATAWPFFGEEVHSPVDIRQDECDRIDNKIDVLSKTFLGLTVSCARCHDHKFDALYQDDYYALAGFVLSSSYRQARFDSIEKNKLAAKQLEALRDEFRVKIAGRFVGQARDRLPSEPVEVVIAPSYKFDARVIADYTTRSPTPWITDGPTYGQRPLRPGEILVGGDPKARALDISAHGGARRDPFWNGLKVIDSENDSGSFDGISRAGKMIRTPSFEIGSGEFHFLIRGKAKVYAAVSQHIMITGPLHGSLIRELKIDGDEPRWVTHGLNRYSGLRAHFELWPVGDEPFEILKIVEGEKPKAIPAKPQRLSPAALHATLDDLADGSLQPRHFAAAKWITDNIDVNAGDIASDYLEGLEKLRAEVQWESRTAVAWMGGDGVEEKLLDRGSPKSPGEPVERRLPRVFGTESITTKDCGRLQLAQQIASPDNPLTARVMVNRVWHQLFGRGLIETTDNFGWLGKRPTHPELLDYLAVEFVERHQWSLKSLIERLVLSETFAMSSESADPNFADHDPKNLWLHRMPMRRIEAEAVRDAALTISGRLDRKVGGKPVPVYLSEFVVGRGRPAKSGPLDGAGRRSIYTSVRRNFLPTLMLAFDFPTPFSTVGERDVTNLPAQSLALMNDPFLYDQAGVWADRILKQMPDAQPPTRLKRMYEEAFARHPSDRELAACIGSLTEFASLYGDDPNARDAWRDLCHSMFSINEFIYVK